jgi:hypothetical protein
VNYLFTLKAKHYNKNIKVYIDGNLIPTEKRLGSYTYVANLAEGKHRVRIVKDAILEQSNWMIYMFISWVLIFFGVSEFTLRELKSTSKQMDYTKQIEYIGEAHISGHCYVEFDVLNDGITILDEGILTTRVNTSYSSLKSEKRLRYIYTIPLILIILIIYSFLVFVGIVFLVAKRYILFLILIFLTLTSIVYLIRWTRIS